LLNSHGSPHTSRDGGPGITHTQLRLEPALAALERPYHGQAGMYLETTLTKPCFACR